MDDLFFPIFSTAGWVGAVLFLVIYHRTSRWWRHGYGRALFILGVVIVSFFTTSTLYNLIGPDYPGRHVLRTINLAGGVLAVWYLLITLVRNGAAVRQAKRDDAVGLFDPDPSGRP